MNLHALDVSIGAIAFATPQNAIDTSDINGEHGKSNFPVPEETAPAA